jgi:hypothetical protein
MTLKSWGNAAVDLCRFRQRPRARRFKLHHTLFSKDLISGFLILYEASTFDKPEQQNLTTSRSRWGEVTRHPREYLTLMSATLQETVGWIELRGAASLCRGRLPCGSSS